MNTPTLFLLPSPTNFIESKPPYCGGDSVPGPDSTVNYFSATSTSPAGPWTVTYPSVGWSLGSNSQSNGNMRIVYGAGKFTAARYPSLGNPGDCWTWTSIDGVNWVGGYNGFIRHGYLNLKYIPWNYTGSSGTVAVTSNEYSLIAFLTYSITAPSQYAITLPPHDQYPNTQTAIFNTTGSIYNDPQALAQSIINVRPTYTANFGDNYVVTIDTHNSNVITPNPSITNIIPPVTGNISLAILSGVAGPSRDVITLTDPVSHQQYVYSPPVNSNSSPWTNSDTASQIVAGETLSGWASSVLYGMGNDSAFRLTSVNIGEMANASLPTVTVVRGNGNSTLTVTRNIKSNGN